MSAFTETITLRVYRKDVFFKCVQFICSAFHMNVHV